MPKLQSAGWDNELHSIAEQRTITDGRIVPVGKGFVRKPPKRVDYLLRYTRDFPLAVIEAKPSYKAASDGLQQAKNYAEMLGLKFAYATNGPDIIEFDYFTGLEKPCSDYPTPAELWQRYRAGSHIKDQQVADRLLTPFVEKANVWLGRVTILSDGSENFKLHILLGSPHETTYNKAYGKAQNILNKVPCEHEFVKEEDVESFAEHLKQDISRHFEVEQKIKQKGKATVKIKR